MTEAKSETIYGGIEAGGTKFICIVGTGPGDIRASTRIATTTPAETLSEVISFFEQQMLRFPLKAVGIGSFGPLDLKETSKTYGYIADTPKPGWSWTNLRGVIENELKLPVYIDTDVNAAALGEHKWGAGRDLDPLVYITVGTGIGGGGIFNGRLMHGLNHPEMGHIRIPHDETQDPFPGSCPFHGDCLEGLASGYAMEKRWGIPPAKIINGHPAWELESSYLALGVMNLVCTLSPQRIIIGGGVMHQPGILEGVQLKVRELLNGYIHTVEIMEDISKYIVLPGLGDNSGVLGAIALAQPIQK